jgi:rhamnosyl/mannosyltransferase
MRANLATKRRTLARAGAVIAPSSVIARDLEERAPELAQTPIYTIPHPIDMTRVDDLHAHAPRPLDHPYVVYAGKLAPNKGVQYLMQAYRNAGIDWPLVIVGDGPQRAPLEAEARALAIDARFLGWCSRDETLGWIRHAAFVAFPSYGPESLSRVLIEASALGTPAAAMDTGGTRDIIHAGITGLLSDSPAAFSQDLARLFHDERLRHALGAQARIEARARFSTPSVVERVEQVYRRLLLPRAA